MDITNDIVMNIFYKKYVKLCNDYESGVIDDEKAVNELKTLHETVGMYVTGLFEIKRREKGGGVIGM